jgi:hypothetical protein
MQVTFVVRVMDALRIVNLYIVLVEQHLTQLNVQLVTILYVLRVLGVIMATLVIQEIRETLGIRVEQPVILAILEVPPHHLHVFPKFFLKPRWLLQRYGFLIR